jgi:hypothetical protein
VRGRGWIAAFVLIVITAGLVFLTPNQPARSPDHRSSSDAPDGTSALLRYAGVLGHPGRPMTGSFAPPSGRGLLFVFTPTERFTGADAEHLAAWVRQGGTLVYASLDADPELDRALSVSRRDYEYAPPDAGLGTTPAISLAAPDSLFMGVDHVSGGPAAQLLKPGPRQVVMLRVETSGHAVGLVFSAGRGTVVALGDPQVLCNSSLGRDDNGRLAADILSLAPPGAPVLFDEFHHGVGTSTPSLFDWVGSPVGSAVFWLILVVYVGLLLRSRAFGPTLPIGFRRGRSTAEYTTAVGALLRRAHARAATHRLLSEAAHRALAERVGVGHGVPPAQLVKVLETRAPDLASELGEATALAGGAARSDRELHEAARRLHALAYPSPRSK